MRIHTALVAAALTLLALPSTPAGAAPPETIVGFGLPSGAAVTVPHVEGDRVVDGTLRIPVEGDHLRLVGKAGAAYVVEVDFNRVVRVAADGTTTRLGRTFGNPAHLAEEGDRVVTSRIRRSGTSTVKVRAVTGATLGSRTFQGRVSAMDVRGDQVLIAGARRTQLWNTATGATTTVSKHAGYQGDLAEDLVAVVSEPRIEGGCTDVLRISTGATIWSTCEHSVLRFGPGGRMVTAGAYLDGPLGLIELRTVMGRLLAAYRTDRTAAIDVVGWESPTALLVGLEGEQRTGIARCTLGDCELAAATKRAARAS